MNKKRYHFAFYNNKWFVFDGNNQLDLRLTSFAKLQAKMSAKNTVEAYLRQILHWLNYYDHLAAGFYISFSAEKIRLLLFAFLAEHYKCKLKPLKGDDEHYLIQRTANSPAYIGIFLSAINALFRGLIRLGLYEGESPTKFLSTDEKSSISSIGLMPLISGCRASNETPSFRLSNNYFIRERSEWVPRTIDCENFPELIFSGGESQKWSQREILICRVLFETGARLSEVLGLTLHDWASQGLQQRASIFSKGSEGVRVKYIIWSKTTTKLLIRYFNEQRKSISKERQGLDHYFTKNNEDYLKSVFIFINRNGVKVKDNSYRKLYWNKAVTYSRIKANPHQARHWFVTSKIRIINEDISIGNYSKEETESRYESLIRYMGWRSGRAMLDVYNHHLQRDRIVQLQERLHMHFHCSISRQIDKNSSDKKMDESLTEVFSVTENRLQHEQ